MKVKFFTSSESFEALENEINEFVDAENVGVISLTPNTLYGHDFFEDGRICNQWIDYTVTLIYKEL